MERLLFSIALAAGLALVAFGCAPAQISLPNTVSAGKITMDYPDGFTAHGDGELRQTVSTKLDGTTDSYEHASASVLNEDYSAHIALDQYDGVPTTKSRIPSRPTSASKCSKATSSKRSRESTGLIPAGTRACWMRSRSANSNRSRLADATASA